MKGSGNLLLRSETLAFKKITHVVKSNLDITKSNNNSLAHSMVVVDANLISFKAPKDSDGAKCTDIIASLFADNGVVVVMVMADNPVRQHDSKREISRRRVEKDRA